MNLKSEDLLTSLLWSHLRLLDPNIFLRRFINESLGHEEIKEGELSYKNMKHAFWQKMSPPRERTPRNRELYEFMPELFSRETALKPKEGKTEADCLLTLGNHLENSPLAAILMIEMKLNAQPSSSTSYDPHRDQISRNVDVLWFHAEECDVKRFYYILFDNQFRPAREIQALRDPLTLMKMIPDRNYILYPAEQVSRSIGWISYRKIRDLLWETKPLLKEGAEATACSDLILLLDDVISRNTPKRAIFDDVSNGST